MSDTYEITKQQFYILIAASAFLAGLFFVLGLVMGKNVELPRVFPSPEEMAQQAVVTDGNLDLPESLESLHRKNTDTSVEPHVPNEGMTFYSTLKTTEPTAKPQPKATPEMVVSVEKFNPATTSSGAKGLEKPQNTPKPDEWYSVQVSSVSDRKAAEKLRKKLSGRKYPVYVSEIQYRNKRVSYRVRVGPFSSRKLALDSAQRLEKDERLSTWVVQVNRDEASN